MTPPVERLIDELQLTPHPEGGYFRRIHASAATVEWAGRTRPAVTAIHFLLAHGQVSAWHRVDADECWHWRAGSPLELRVYDPEAETLGAVVLGAVGQGEAMHVVPAGHWQAARPLGEYAQVVCTVSPGFVWEGFELLRAGSAIERALQRAGGLPL